MKIFNHPKTENWAPRYIHREVKKVGWIRVGALGDLLVGTVNLADTHMVFPNAEVTVIGDKIWTEILSPEQWPRIASIIVLENRGALKGIEYKPHGDGWKPMGEPLPLSHFYKNFGATVNTRYESLRYAWGPWACGVKIRYGMSEPYLKWVYTHWSPSLGKDPVIHERDLATFILRAATRVGKFPNFFSPNHNEARRIMNIMIEDGDLKPGWEATALPRLRKEIPIVDSSNRGAYWIVNPTASRKEKAWSPKKFRELILILKVKLEPKNIKIIVVGSPKESAWLKEVAAEDFKIVQPQSISELIHLVGEARVVISNTSSMQFIAAATNTRVVTLMGHANPQVWGPLGPHDIYLKPDPIDTKEADIFKLEELYFDKLSVEQVYKVCNNLLV